MKYLFTVPCTFESKELFAPVFSDEVAIYKAKWMRERDFVKIEENPDIVASTTVEKEESCLDIQTVVKTEYEAADLHQQQ